MFKNVLFKVPRTGCNWISGSKSIARSSTQCVDVCSHMRYMDIKCKVALITGATSGIGWGIANELLKRGLKKAYITSTNTRGNAPQAVQTLEKNYGKGKAEFIYLDVNVQKQFEDIFKDIICNDGNIDILVNNAGMLNDANWESQLNTNVKGVVRGAMLANKYMPKQKNKGGVVINVASILGYDTFPFIPGYNSTKHAVVGFTKAFGDPGRYSKTGVRHLALGPGVTRTHLVRGSADKQLNVEYGEKTFNALNSLPDQTIDATGRGTAYMIEYGPPGSLWIVEGWRLERLRPPNRKKYLEKIMDL